MTPAINASTVRSTGPRDRQRWRRALLIAQTALSVALLVSGGVLMRAYFRTSHMAVGFDPSGVLTAQLQLPPARYATGPERVAAMERIFDRMAALPGVTQSGATMNRFTPGFAYLTTVDIEVPDPLVATENNIWIIRSDVAGRTNELASAESSEIVRPMEPSWWARGGGGEFANVASNWLRWQFKSDKQAAKMFVGKDCSLCTNPNWNTASKRLQ